MSSNNNFFSRNQYKVLEGKSKELALSSFMEVKSTTFLMTRYFIFLGLISHTNKIQTSQCRLKLVIVPTQQNSHSQSNVKGNPNTIADITVDYIAAH